MSETENYDAIVAELRALIVRMEQQPLRNPDVRQPRKRRQQPLLGGRTLWALAEQEIRRCEKRSVFFTDEFASGPAWNILIDLLQAQIENRTISITSACIAARCPPTTALRYIERLIAKGLVQRQRDELDRRRWFLFLTETTFRNFRNYMVDVERVESDVAARAAFPLQAGSDER